MRKKETKLASKMLHNKLQHNASGYLGSDSGGLNDLDGQPTISKEQQLKLLNEILIKIEGLEGKVKQQVSKQKQTLAGQGGGLFGANSSQNNYNFETSSNNKSSNSFHTGSKRGYF
jgi:hypothetical protein